MQVQGNTSINMSSNKTSKACASSSINNAGIGNNATAGLFGLFDRSGIIKHVNTQMINWHGSTGTVFSVDIQLHSSSCKNQRLVTGGSDNNVQIWELKRNSSGIGVVEHLSQLSRHDSAVNTVRFHPSEDVLASTSDDRCIFIWKYDASAADAPDIFAKSDDEQDRFSETWVVIKQLRGHGSEVYDIAWSPDSKYLAAATMDYTTYIWDTASSKKKKLLQHHKGYVQGVAWDPNNEFLVTVSADRSVMVYDTKKFDVHCKINRFRGRKSNMNNGNDKGNKDIRMFLDTGMVDTFFRRPGISPDGKLLALPCGSYEIEDPSAELEIGKSEKAESDNSEDKYIQINVVYIFQHLNLQVPVMCIPTGKSPAIAIRFCPQLFQLRNKKDPKSPNVFNSPYRMIYAIVTLDNVLLCDTQQTRPFAAINSIHYEQLTDAAWSADGSFLVVSSIDGFCTIVTLEKHLLGQLYTPCDVELKENLEEATKAEPPIMAMQID